MHQYLIYYMEEHTIYLALDNSSLWGESMLAGLDTHLLQYYQL
jgi:hypothetical protein